MICEVAVLEEIGVEGSRIAELRKPKVAGLYGVNWFVLNGESDLEPRSRFVDWSRLLGPPDSL